MKNLAEIEPLDFSPTLTHIIWPNLVGPTDDNLKRALYLWPTGKACGSYRQSNLCNPRPLDLFPTRAITKLYSIFFLEFIAPSIGAWFWFLFSHFILRFLYRKNWVKGSKKNDWCEVWLGTRLHLTTCEHTCALLLLFWWMCALLLLVV